MSNEFYCGHCGRFKKIELKMKPPAGKRPVCSLCMQKQQNLIGEASRDKTRARNAKRKTLAYLIPNGV